MVDDQGWGIVRPAGGHVTTKGGKSSPQTVDPPNLQGWTKHLRVPRGLVWGVRFFVVMTFLSPQPNNIQPPFKMGATHICTMPYTILLTKKTRKEKKKAGDYFILF